MGANGNDYKVWISPLASKNANFDHGNPWTGEKKCSFYPWKHGMNMGMPGFS
jgi:hypothetical protein